MTTVTAFDFDRKTIETLAPGDVKQAIARGRYCWIDFDDCAAAIAALPALGIDVADVGRIERDQQQCQAWHGRACVHCVLVDAKYADGDLRLDPVHVFIAENLVATVHAGPSPLVERVRGTCRHDFLTTAESGGFLLFEFADHLITSYRETMATLTADVDGIQRRLLENADDEILTDVSQLTRALLSYRGAVVAARETIDELATRRSPFVPASTQPFLDRQTLPLDRLAHDAATERTVLSESVNLYMGIVSHRTNRLVNRLTIVSIIFLPLNFLAAVYGMNFETMPELSWRFGYLGFWLFSLLLVGTLLVTLRRKRWI